VTLRPSRIAALAIIAAVVTSIANCGRIAFGVVNTPAYAGRYERLPAIPYGTDRRQSLDVYRPVGAFNRPVVVFWYGGMWTKGSKEQYRFVGAALANSGYVAILPDYRLYPQVRFPDFVDDGARAVKWAHDHAAEIGGDPHALFLMGHSAGAHIAASLALDERHLQKVGGNENWVRAWIGLAGPYALKPAIPLLEVIFHKPYTEADWQPLAMVNRQSPPVLILHGIGDNMVHATDAVEFDRKLRAAGVPVECHLYEGASHFNIVAAFSIPMRDDAPTLADVTRFIDRTLAVPVSARELNPDIPCPTLLPGRDFYRFTAG
jgi:acetyl esterase/lipase